MIISQNISLILSTKEVGILRKLVNHNTHEELKKNKFTKEEMDILTEFYDLLEPFDK